MRLMRLGRLLSFMSSRAKVLPPSSLTAAIESLPAAPEAVVIRDHARKFQFVVSHGMLFRKS